MQDLTLAAVSVSCEFSGSVWGFSSALLPLSKRSIPALRTSKAWASHRMRLVRVCYGDEGEMKMKGDQPEEHFKFLFRKTHQWPLNYCLWSHCRHALRQSYFGFLSPLSSTRPWAKPEPPCLIMSAVDKVISARNWGWRSSLCHSGKSEWLSCHANGVVRGLLGFFHFFQFLYTYRLEHPQKHGRGFCSRTPWVPGLFVVVCSSSGFRWVCACKQPSQMAWALHVLLRANVVPEYTSSHPYFVLALLLTVCKLGWASNTPRYRRCSVYLWARPLIINNYWIIELVQYCKLYRVMSISSMRCGALLELHFQSNNLHAMQLLYGNIIVIIGQCILNNI